MSFGDLRAVQQITELANKHGNKLVDLSKFVFFGRDKNHKWTESFSSFAAHSLAEHISSRSPLLAATLMFFNDVMNKSLLRPDNIFEKGQPAKEVQARFDRDIKD